MEKTLGSGTATAPHDPSQGPGNATAK
jgi:hypothetical protein